MSTLKSSAEDLTLNADGSGNDIIFQSNGSNVATLDQAGLFTATSFAGSGASLTGIATPITALNNATESELVTVGSTTTELDAESGLTFDGTNLTLTSSDIVFATAGKGICLGVTTNTDSNTLDDYEEGTFTPTLSFGGGTTGITYGTQVGSYVKIGQLVFLSLRITLTDKGSSSGGGQIHALPFTQNSTAGAYGGGVMGFANNWDNSEVAGKQNHMFTIDPNGSIMYLRALNTDGSYFSLTNSYMEDNTDMVITVTYRTA